MKDNRTKKLIGKLHWEWMDSGADRNPDSKIKYIRQFALQHMTIKAYLVLESLISEEQADISELSFRAGYKKCLECMGNRNKRMKDKLLDKLHWTWLESEKSKKLNSRLQDIYLFSLLHMSEDDYLDLESLISQEEYDISELSFRAGYNTCLEFIWKKRQT